MSFLPLEIDERIVDLLAEDDDERYLAVKACSLVCQTFLPLCRKHIFASIILNRYSSPITRQLERLLSKSPEIADYIRKLDYSIVLHEITDPLIPECLKRISRLRSLSLRDYLKYLDWSSNGLRPVLLHLLHLPTLTHFQVIGINNFLASDLIPCINLKKLDIGHHTTGAATNTFYGALPDRSIQLNEFVVGIRNSTAIMNIYTAQRPDGQPVIDFSSLPKIKLTLEVDSDVRVSQDLFQSCKQLTHVHISILDPRWIRLSLSKMLQPSMQTLIYLDITNYVDDIDLDPLAGIPSQLEDMRNKNIIEKIAIRVMVQTYKGCSRGDEWGRLDEVLTKSGWIALREISVTIGLEFIHRDDEWAVALRKLPLTQFPRLSRSKYISFKFKVTTGSIH